MLQRALLSPVPAVSTAMKEIYLQWAYRTGGYKKARKLFSRYTHTLSEVNLVTPAVIVMNTLINVQKCGVRLNFINL